MLVSLNHLVGSGARRRESSSVMGRKVPKMIKIRNLPFSGHADIKCDIICSSVAADNNVIKLLLIKLLWKIIIK